MTPCFGYWNVRGIGQPIRSLLEFTREQYEDKLYTHSFASALSVPRRPERTTDFVMASTENMEWLQDKYCLGLDFPNLPYYVDGDFKMSGSSVIARYIARKHNLVGQTETEILQVDMLQHTTYDIYWSQFLPIVIQNVMDRKKMKQEMDGFVNGPLPGHLENFSKYLGDKKFFVGDNVTYVDFFLYELFLNFSYVASDLMNKYTNIQNYQERIEALPAIAKYMKTERYTKYFEKPMTARLFQ